MADGSPYFFKLSEQFQAQSAAATNCKCLPNFSASSSFSSHSHHRILNRACTCGACALPLQGHLTSCMWPYCKQNTRPFNQLSPTFECNILLTLRGLSCYFRPYENQQNSRVMLSNCAIVVYRSGICYGAQTERQAKTHVCLGTQKRACFALRRILIKERSPFLSAKPTASGFHLSCFSYLCSSTIRTVPTMHRCTQESIATLLVH